MKKILLVNRKHTDNLGDIAIGEALVHLFSQRGCEVYHLEYSTLGKDIDSFGQNQNSFDAGTATESQGTLRRLKRSLAKRLPRKAFWFYNSGRRLLRQIREIPKDEIDLIVIGGGQLIQSEPKNDKFAYAFKLWNWVNRHILKTKLAILSVGAKEGFSPYATKAYKAGLSHADFIYVRDHHSKEVLERLNPDLKVNVIPDVAFSLSDAIELHKAEGTEKKIALVGIYDYRTYCKINSHEPDRSSYYEEWKNKIVELTTTGFTVQLFYSTGTDKLETQQFSEYLGNKYEVVEANSLNDLVKLLNNADHVYSGRMHALILAIVSGCQVEAFITNTKLKVFDESYIQLKPDLKAINQEIEQVIDTVLASLSDN